MLSVLAPDRPTWVQSDDICAQVRVEQLEKEGGGLRNEISAQKQKIMTLTADLRTSIEASGSPFPRLLFDTMTILLADLSASVGAGDHFPSYSVVPSLQPGHVPLGLPY